MKIVFTIVLAIVVIIATIVFMALSSCMASYPTKDNLLDMGVLALCCLGVIGGGVFLIARINRNY